MKRIPKFAVGDIVVFLSTPNQYFNRREESIRKVIVTEQIYLDGPSYEFGGAYRIRPCDSNPMTTNIVVEQCLTSLN